MVKENQSGGDKENTNNQNVSDGVACKLSELGCDPEKWSFVLQDCLKLDNGMQKKKILKQFFYQAKKHLDPEANRKSETYARILAQEALFVNESNKQDAQVAFRFAINTCRRVPFIHVAFAQYELDCGRPEKAKKILEFASTILPQCNVVHDAIVRLNNGSSDLGVKCEEMFQRETNFSSRKVKVAKLEFGDSENQILPSNKHSLTDTCINSPLRTTHLNRGLEALDIPESPRHFEQQLRLSPVLSTLNVRNIYSRPPTFSNICEANMKTPLQKNKIPETPRETPGFKTPLQKNKSAFVERLKNVKWNHNISTPSPPRLSFSVTKSLARKHHPSHQPLSEHKLMTSSQHNHGLRQDHSNRPRRIPCSLQKNALGLGESSGLLVVPLTEACGKPLLSHATPEQVPPATSINSNTIQLASTDTSVPHVTSLPQTSATCLVASPPNMPQHNESDKVSIFLRGADILNIQGKLYLVLKVLGEGGSSKVLEVFDIEAKVTKAVKHVKLKNCEASIKQGFLDEVKFLEKLQNNPSIVHLYTYELHGDDLYIVMECGSTDLSKLIKSSNSKFESYEVWYFWKKMLAAVNAVHHHDIIHLDLKPANFLLVKGNLKLIDFGIANSIQSDVTSVYKDTMVGTLNYMAPEAIVDMSGDIDGMENKFKISPRADVWSLGCILYLMMYGKTPFQHINHQLRKLSAITNPNTRIEFPQYSDKRLMQIVQSCLVRDPKKRPSVTQLVQYS